MRLLWARFTGRMKAMFGMAKPPVPEEDLQRYLDDGGGVIEEPVAEA